MRFHTEAQRHGGEDGIKIFFNKNYLNTKSYDERRLFFEQQLCETPYTLWLISSSSLSELRASVSSV